MLKFEKIREISLIKHWLDDISYKSLNQFLNTFLNQKNTIYPDFSMFMANIAKLNPLYAFTFSVFRFGQPADLAFFQSFIPEKVFHALLRTGLLVKSSNNYRMPNICIIPFEGFYFITSLPSSYPTCSRNTLLNTITSDTSLIANELKNKFNNTTNFLEINSDYGVLSNIACSLGSNDVSILPSSNIYKEFILFNLALNANKAKIIDKEKLRSGGVRFNLVAGINLCSNEIDYNSFEIINLAREETITDDLFLPLPTISNNDTLALLFVESLGSMHNIFLNEKINTLFKHSSGIEVSSIVLSKMPLPLHFRNYAHSIMTEGEKRFKSITTNQPFNSTYSEETIKTIGNAYVYKQIVQLKFCKNENNSYTLYPFYNPKYTDPLVGISNFFNQNQLEL
jgi:hypothetical protein